MGKKGKSDSVLSTKNGEPSIHMTQKTVFTGAIIACVAIIIVIGILAMQYCNRDCPKTPPTSTQPAAVQMQPQSGKTTPLKLRENNTGFMGPLTDRKLALLMNGPPSRENSTGQRIKDTFVRDVKKPIVENYMATPKHVWHAPPGVQPGTLVTPPIGYTRVISNVDRGKFNTTHPISNYKWSPEQKTTLTEYVNRDGSISVGPNQQFGDSAPNGLGYYGGVKQPKMERMVAKREFAIMNELGSTDHSFQSSNNLQDGITGETWEGDKSNWSALRSNSEANLKKISKMFDELLLTDIFPGLSKEEVQGGGFKVKTADGQCVFLERYYEWVSNCFRVQLGLPPNPMPWAEGSQIKLGFEHVDASVPDLRLGLVAQCMSAPVYRQDEEGNLKSSATDDLVAYPVIWPKSMDLLYTHFFRAMQ